MKNQIAPKIQEQKLPPSKYFKIGRFSVRVRPVASASLSAKRRLQEIKTISEINQVPKIQKYQKKILSNDNKMEVAST